MIGSALSSLARNIAESTRLRANQISGLVQDIRRKKFASRLFERVPDAHDLGTWTDTVESLLADPDRRRDLGRRASVHAQAFGWGATTDHLLEVYAEARRVRSPTPMDPLAAVVQAPPALIP